MDQQSNVDSDAPGADLAGFTDAISHAESDVNYRLAMFGYPTGTSSPTFPTGSMAYSSLSDVATMLAAYWLYVKRGITDQGDDVGGKFAKIKRDAEAMIERILRNKIPDVARGFTCQPAVVLFGRGPVTQTPASQIPQVP